MSFLDFLYKVLIFSLVNPEGFFSDLATLALARTNNKVTSKTKNRPSAENSLKIEFRTVYLHGDIDCMGEFRKVM